MAETLMWRCELVRRDPDHWRIWRERWAGDHDGPPIDPETLCRAVDTGRIWRRSAVMTLVERIRQRATPPPGEPETR